MLNANLHSHLNIQHVNYQYLYTSFWWGKVDGVKRRTGGESDGIVAAECMCATIENLLWHANRKSHFADTQVSVCVCVHVPYPPHDITITNSVFFFSFLFHVPHGFDSNFRFLFS